ncbi:hypothetical protein RB195_011633 [Necator americanus]|uniref:ShKT domain-containing protein n=1 Tax=Necator americanus TaxID=51031 RepID=A0ABR1D3C5_NECAM
MDIRPTTRSLVLSPGPAGPTLGAFAVSAVASSTSPTTAYECMDIGCLCSGGTNCVLPNGQTLTKAIRKEYRVLTDDERQRYLFCDLSHGTPRCASKILIGGNCGGYTNSKTCFNEQQCCGPWANRGECTRNPVYMRVWYCSDGNQNCPVWTARGECIANRAYMWENCRRSCGARSLRPYLSRRKPLAQHKLRTTMRRPMQPHHRSSHSALRVNKRRNGPARPTGRAAYPQG